MVLQRVGHDWATFTFTVMSLQLVPFGILPFFSPLFLLSFGLFLWSCKISTISLSTAPLGFIFSAVALYSIYVITVDPWSTGTLGHQPSVWLKICMYLQAALLTSSSTSMDSTILWLCTTIVYIYWKKFLYKWTCWVQTNKRINCMYVKLYLR